MEGGKERGMGVSWDQETERYEVDECTEKEQKRGRANKEEKKL